MKKKKTDDERLKEITDMMSDKSEKESNPDDSDEVLEGSGPKKMPKKHGMFQGAKKMLHIIIAMGEKKK